MYMYKCDCVVTMDVELPSFEYSVTRVQLVISDNSINICQTKRLRFRSIWKLLKLLYSLSNTGRWIYLKQSNESSSIKSFHGKNSTYVFYREAIICKDKIQPYKKLPSLDRMNTQVKRNPSRSCVLRPIWHNLICQRQTGKCLFSRSDLFSSHSVSAFMWLKIKMLQIFN